MFVDGMLIPANALVNGITMTLVEMAVDYFHVALETHDVILAENAPSETLLDDDSRLRNAAPPKAPGHASTPPTGVIR